MYLYLLLAKKESEVPTFFQFGKVDSDTFALDFAFPFSPLQAFCVGLAIFDVSWTLKLLSYICEY